MSSSPLPTVLITGASQGIGRALAINLSSSKKYKLALISRNNEKLSKTIELCQKANKNVKIKSFICDITDEKRLKQCINNVGNNFGPFAVLINNAGIQYPQLMDKNTKINEVNKVISTNLNAVIHACSLSVPFLKQTKLRNPDINVCIIQISSVGSTIRSLYETVSVYTASKFGIRGFSNVLFKELKDFGIKVCQIMAGIVNTPMVQRYAGMVVFENMIDVKDISAAVNYVLTCSDTVCPLEIVLCPQKNAIKVSKL